MANVNAYFVDGEDERCDTDEASTVAEELENAYITNRLEIVSEKMIATPLAVLSDMAETFEQKIESEEYHFFLPKVREIMWRVEMAVGKLKGTGEAPLCKLASHMAAAEILEQIKKSGGVTVPAYGLLPGCRLSPNIAVELAYMCDSMDLDAPTFYYEEKKLTKNIEEGPWYKVYCKVGKLILRADSDSLVLAKRLVARDMYETLSVEDEVYKEYSIVNGSNCTPSFFIKKLNLNPVSEVVTDDVIDEIRQKKREEYEERENSADVKQETVDSTSDDEGKQE